MQSACRVLATRLVQERGKNALGKLVTAIEIPEVRLPADEAARVAVVQRFEEA